MRTFPILLLFLATAGPSLASEPPAQEAIAKSVTIVAKDFVIEAYHNGVRVPDAQREMLEERFGSMVERVHITVRTGDWLVFHVVNNRIRHGGTKFFGAAGDWAPGEFGFVTDPKSEAWSVCDDPALAYRFIHQREAGTESRAQPIANPWHEGMGYLKQFAGADFPGQPLWGTAPSTWIKFRAQPGAKRVVAQKKAALSPLRGEIVFDVFGTEYDPSLPAAKAKVEPKPKAKEEPPTSRLLEPKRWRVQVLSAVYGTAGKDADVIAKVRDLVEEKPRFFAVNPVALGADPNPGWNKSLHIVYMKDGVRREQRRNENEHVLPESFYGPQDTAELSAWLPGSRWMGVKGEVQFHAGGALTGPQMPPAATWEAIAANRLRIAWSPELKTEYVFDYTWSSFSAPEDGQNSFRIKN